MPQGQESGILHRAWGLKVAFLSICFPLVPSEPMVVLFLPPVAQCCGFVTSPQIENRGGAEARGESLQKSWGEGRGWHRDVGVQQVVSEVGREGVPCAVSG